MLLMSFAHEIYLPCLTELKLQWQLRHFPLSTNWPLGSLN